MGNPTPPPEAVLIEKLRRGIKPSLSIRRAAERAEVSEGRWRQIEKGYQQVGQDVQVAAQARPETLARMARVVGATPEALTGAGRDDAAQALRALIHYASTEPQAAYTEPGSVGADAVESDEIYELDTARTIQYMVAAILGTSITFTDEEIAELREIQATAKQLPEIFGKLLGVRMGRRELMRNCLSLHRRIINVLRHHASDSTAPVDTESGDHGWLVSEGGSGLNQG